MEITSAECCGKKEKEIGVLLRIPLSLKNRLNERAEELCLTQNQFIIDALNYYIYESRKNFLDDLDQYAIKNFIIRHDLYY
jgi:predicted DNA-binding protein